MAAKIIFLLALVLSPLLLSAQNIKPTFSLELKPDKLNYEFGEEVKLTLILKNITDKIDSIAKNEIEDLSNANMSLFKDGNLIRCEIILSSFAGNTYVNIKPNEEYIKEVYLNQTCGKPLLGKFSYENYLDTGFYNGFSCLYYTKNRSKNEIHYCLKSNEIYFRVISYEESKIKAFNNLKMLLDFTIENFRDSVFMRSKIQDLYSFIYKNINSPFSDDAYYITGIYRQIFNANKHYYTELSKYYLSNRPNGTKVYFALFEICVAECKKYNSSEAGKRILENYIEAYPNTKIEKEAKRILGMKVEF